MYSNKRQTAWFKYSRTLSSLIDSMNSIDLKKLRSGLRFLRTKPSATLLLRLDVSRSILIHYTDKEKYDLLIQFMNGKDEIEAYMVISGGDPISVLEDVIDISLRPCPFNKQERIRDILLEYVTDCCICK